MRRGVELWLARPKRVRSMRLHISNVMDNVVSELDPCEIVAAARGLPYDCSRTRIPSLVGPELSKIRTSQP